MKPAANAPTEYLPGTDFASIFAREMKVWVLPARFGRLPPDRKIVLQPDVANRLVGLALSGGGIRSATFSLGACQALARSGILEHVDYLSTVSGGAYFGSAISSLLHWSAQPKKGHALAAENFPFRFGPHGDGQIRAFKAERPPVRRLREMSNYLAPRLGVLDTQTWYAVIRIVTQAALLLALLALPPLALILTALAGVPEDLWSRDNPLGSPGVVLSPLAAAGVGLLAFTAIQLSALGRQPFFASLARVLLYLIVVVAVWLAFVFGVSFAWPIPAEIKAAFSAGGSIALIAAGRWAYSKLGDIARALDSELGSASIGRSIRMTLPQVLFGVLGYLVLAMLLILGYIAIHHGVPAHLRWPVVGLLAALTGATLTWPKLVGLLNAWSLHSFYRDRLRDAYIQSEKAPEPEVASQRGTSRGIHPALGDLQNDKVTFGAAADRPLSELQWKNREASTVLGPYPIIGSALNMAGSTEVELLGRKSDAFFLAPLYSGSSITGYVRTDQAYKNLSLGDAMAISGSAFSPNQGSATTTSLAILLTLLNARLGYWLRNPLSFLPTWRPRLTLAGPLMLYWKELFGKAGSNDASVYLSDGGHFDNSGIYELVRRRCRYIVAIDGSGEPPLGPPRFGTLGAAGRLVRIDFGADIQIDLESLIPDVDGRTAAYCAIGRVEYPATREDEPLAERSGLLIYLKSTLTKDMPSPDLEFYRRLTTVFPNHSTADQFFDEPQFESYRQLGYVAARTVFRHALDFPKGSPEMEAGRALTKEWNRHVAAPPVPRQGRTHLSIGFH